MILFNARKVLHTSAGEQLFDISFQLQKEKLLTIYGSSGAGKTTLLRILAGLTNIQEGYIEVDGEVWYDAAQKINRPVQQRAVGVVFQDYALFPHLSIKENIAFGIERGNDKAIVDELIEIMELEALQNKKPATLSGGQKQRVALARAIARKPKLLLLDEPLSALDNQMRSKLQDFIFKVHGHYHLTTLLVSHHLPEIFRLSDEVLHIDKGKIKKWGTPSVVFKEQNISGKFKMTGEVIQIEKSDIVFIVSVLCANTIVQVVATQNEVSRLKVGQKVLVASKAFNPVLLQLDEE